MGVLITGISRFFKTICFEGSGGQFTCEYLDESQKLENVVAKTEKSDI